VIDVPFAMPRLATAQAIPTVDVPLPLTMLQPAGSPVTSVIVAPTGLVSAIVIVPPAFTAAPDGIVPPADVGGFDTSKVHLVVLPVGREQKGLPVVVVVCCARPLGAPPRSNAEASMATTIRPRISQARGLTAARRSGIAAP
jgi:hypothetical protein